MKILSGIQPTGTIHLGNFLGAIKSHIELQERFESPMYFIADLHALTVPHDPQKLQASILNVAAIYLAAGLNPKKAILFVQSSRAEHAELAWILGTQTTLGELNRMTQFKEKRGQAAQDSVRLGLFSYPVLMAADILLYQPNLVPVGEDQIQHVELTRDLARRFNNRFGEVFVIPEVKLVETGSRIMGLDNPTKKMSKSAASRYNYIALIDEPDVIRQKIMKAVTDSGSEVILSDEKPAIKNLLTIFAAMTHEAPQKIAQRYQGKGYGEFKADLAQVIVESLAPIREKYLQLIKDRTQLKKILNQGSQKAEPIAQDTLKKVKKAVGLI